MFMFPSPFSARALLRRLLLIKIACRVYGTPIVVAESIYLVSFGVMQIADVVAKTTIN